MGVDNAAVARRYMMEIWSNGDVDAIDELCDDEIVLSDPMTPEAVKGKPAVRQRVERMPEIFDSSIRIREIIVSADRVVLLTTWQGVHKGEFLGIAGTGRTVTCECVEVLRIRGGKIIENTSYFDVYSMFQQMGALPPPDQLAARAATTSTNERQEEGEAAADAFIRA
jgi:steroid delta-isomerase-like uncharacterized protein